MSGCLFWYSFNIHSPAIMYMNEVSAERDCRSENNVFIANHQLYPGTAEYKWTWLSSLTELEVGVVGADMVAGTEQAFHHQSSSHRIKQTEMLWDTTFLGGREGNVKNNRAWSSLNNLNYPACVWMCPHPPYNTSHVRFIYAISYLRAVCLNSIP